MAIKKNVPIPEDNHILHHIPWNKLRKNENDEVIGILGEVFKMRETEKYLSANWLEHFTGTYGEQIIAAVQEVRKCLVVRSKSGFAIGKVDDIKTLCTEKRNLKIRIVYYPTTTKTGYKNNSHVAVKSLPADDMELFELLATEAWCHLVLNCSIPD
jgi:hypothetical protein